MRNTEISANFLVREFYANGAFQQNFHTRKLGEFSVFSSVIIAISHFHHVIKYADSPVFDNKFRYQMSLSQSLQVCKIEQMLRTYANVINFIGGTRKPAKSEPFAAIGFPFLSGFSFTELS